jgi:DNA-directed RNA polymerase subunit RPC12/RpoP
MSEPLLGCPHCNKPVGFAAAMAGQVVACPHCRGQFQMPERTPAAAASKQTTRTPAGDVGLTFDNDAVPAGPAMRAELDSYRAATTLANVFALAGSGVVLMVVVLTIYSFVLPLIRGTDDRPSQSVAGLIWLFASLLCAGLAIVGLFLVRACILVLVDAARTLRALERDAAASRSK